MFSRRAHWPHAPNAIAAAVAARRAAGWPIIDLTETNPTAVGLPPLPDDLLALLSMPTVRSYAPEPFGLPAAREEVAALQGVSAEQVCLTASTSEAYSWLFKLLCDPGDNVLVPAPSYPLFELLAKLESVEVRTYPTRSWDDWSIDFESLESQVDERTRALIIVSPNNPTGAMLHTSDRVPLMALCQRRKLAVISDEVFADFAEPRTDRVRTLAGSEEALTFVLGGLSKMCLAPQIKVGWIVASGPAKLRDEALRGLEIIGDTFLSVSTPAQLALGQFLARRNELQAPLKARLRSNRERLALALSGTPASLLPADGGWTAVVRLPESRSEEEWTLDLLARGVLVHPGFFFDFQESPRWVVSLIPEEAVFERGVALLQTCVQGMPA